MTNVKVFTEEPSMTTALNAIFARHLPESVECQVIGFGGIENFFARIPERLRGYRDWIPPEYRIVLLADRDDADCRDRKAKLEDIATSAGFGTKSRPDPNGGYSVISRLAIEELEAWFFGDVAAIRAAYPRVPETLGQRQSFRDPDAIRGGTAEALLRVLNEFGYYRGLNRLPKLEVAQRISEQMDPARNKSPSFRVFWDTVANL